MSYAKRICRCALRDAFLLGSEQESYGYEVVQRLHAVGLSDILEGTVYPALARLEREGRVSARLVSSKAGPARKYYRPTPAGYDALATGWSELDVAVRGRERGTDAPGPHPTDQGSLT